VVPGRRIIGTRKRRRGIIVVLVAMAETIDFSMGCGKIRYINMTKQEGALSRPQQEQDPSRQNGFLTDQALHQRQIERNYNRDKALASEKKETARKVVTGWKASDVEKMTLRARQQVKHSRYQQELQERYPDLFPAPASPPLRRWRRECRAVRRFR